MPRQDYDAIKERFGGFVGALKDADGAVAAAYCVNDVQAFLSPVAAGDSSCHGARALAAFVAAYPRTDRLDMAIYNFICRICGGRAQQSAYVVCWALNRSADGFDCFQYVLIFSNTWARGIDGAWRMACVRMETYDQGGSLKDLYSKTWHFEEPLAVLKVGVHLPCVHGELDAPWYAVPSAEDVLTPEEQVKEAFLKYDFGVDLLAFSLVDDALSPRFRANDQPDAVDGKRSWMTTIKFHRQKARQWVHPYKFISIKIDGDYAEVVCDRMAGERHEVAWTDELAGVELAGARVRLVVLREGGVWRVADFNYESALIEEGPYRASLYGDLC